MSGPGEDVSGTSAPGRDVLLIHQLFVLGSEAGGTRHVELARYLADSGHRVTVIAGPVSYLSGERHRRTGELHEDGIRVLRTWTSEARGGGFLGRLLQFLSFSISSVWAGLFRVPAVDVVWGTSPPIFQALGALKVARLRGVPFVLEVRDLWPDFAVELGVLRSRPLIAMARWAERFLYRQADRVVVNSPGFVEHIRSRGVPSERIALVPNGVEVDAFDPDSDGAAFRREHDLGSRRLVVYTGAHGVPNDLDVLLDAADRLRRRDDVLFVLVGGGRDRDRLMARAEAMGLSNVRFLPGVPKDRMGDVLAAASVCVALLKDIPLFDTTYPNKVFDYMAAGRPTVLAIDGVIREVVEASGGGVFSPPGDAVALASAVETYLDDPARARDTGRAARAYVARHFRRGDQAALMQAVIEGAGSRPIPPPSSPVESNRRP